jgi:hypothetical protein
MPTASTAHRTSHLTWQYACKLGVDAADHRHEQRDKATSTLVSLLLRRGTASPYRDLAQPTIRIVMLPYQMNHKSTVRNVQLSSYTRLHNRIAMEAQTRQGRRLLGWARRLCGRCCTTRKIQINSITSPLQGLRGFGAVRPARGRAARAEFVDAGLVLHNSCCCSRCCCRSFAGGEVHTDGLVAGCSRNVFVILPRCCIPAD